MFQGEFDIHIRPIIVRRTQTNKQIQNHINNNAKKGIWYDVHDNAIMIKDIDSRYATNIKNMAERKGFKCPKEILARIEVNTNKDGLSPNKMILDDIATSKKED